MLTAVDDGYAARGQDPAGLPGSGAEPDRQERRAWQDRVPEDEWDDGASLVDPDGALPPISILKVPEPKTAKNRLHIDLRVAGGRQVDQAVRRERILAMVERLVAAGGTVVREDTFDGHLDHVVMADPEGNELCVV